MISNATLLSRRLDEVQRARASDREEIARLERELVGVQQRDRERAAEEHRLTLALHVGERVRLRYRKGHLLDDAVGTLLVVKRTRGTVDFGPPHGEWRWPLDDLLLESDPRGQGFVMRVATS